MSSLSRASWVSIAVLNKHIYWPWLVCNPVTDQMNIMHREVFIINNSLLFILIILCPKFPIFFWQGDITWCVRYRR